VGRLPSLFGVVVLSQELGGIQIFGIGLILVTVTVLSVFSNTRPEETTKKFE
jgi:multidrug transporter EmrE-like cation transporter